MAELNWSSCHFRIDCGMDETTKGKVSDRYVGGGYKVRQSVGAVKVTLEQLYDECWAVVD